MSDTTLEPVTVGGWYEHTDGSVGLYVWSDGRVGRMVLVDNWEAVIDYKAAADGWCKV